MGIVAETIVRGCRMSINLAELMVKDVTPKMFGRKPHFAGTTIDTNHGAFIYGHLALYPARAMAILGKDATAIQPPSTYEPLFAAGKPCLDDPEGTIYPPMNEITSLYFKAYTTAADAIMSVPDDVFAQPNPREGRIKEMYPTIGGMINFVLGIHPMMHLGQMSTWRRCMGLGPAMT